MSTRFRRPEPGPPAPVRFPSIVRHTLDNGLAVWTIPYGALPVATTTLVIGRGTAEDPPDRHGLASLTGDLLDEGAGRLDAIELADAFARAGTHLNIDTGPDATTLSCAGLSRVLDRILDLMADVVIRPRLGEEDFERVRELRINRLRQLSRSAGSMADRAWVTAVFRDHPYGHGAMGTTAALSAMSVDDARTHWQRHLAPSVATLIVVGDVQPDDVTTAAERAFGAWSVTPDEPVAAPASTAPDARILLVDRPGAAQSELRVGHAAPPRSTPLYHSLVVANAVLGGQFTSRINQRLREEMGITYGAHTSFDFRRLAGSFSCDTSVQTDATADAVREILVQFDAIRGAAVNADELDAARASLTRGYVRNFETAGQISRAAVQLVTYDLPDDTFDRFVPVVGSVTSDDVQRAAREVIDPAKATVVVVGNAEDCRASLEQIGRPIEAVTPEF